MAKKPVKKMAAGGSFSEAFRAARKGGEKTFTWNGNSYTTKSAPRKAKRLRSVARLISLRRVTPRPVGSRRVSVSV